MGYLKVVVLLVAALLIIDCVSAAGSCPDKSKVYDTKRKCNSDADCQKWGQLCCPNQMNTKSCAERAPYSNQSRDSMGNKYKDTANNKYNNHGMGAMGAFAKKRFP